MISLLDKPGTGVYHHEPDCACVGDEGGNSYIIANNKFGYETRGNLYSTPQNDVTIQNNGTNTIPYNATEADVNDPTNPAYKVLTGLYDTKCMNCSPQSNLIRRSMTIVYNSQAYYETTRAKLQSRCQTYEQNISTNPANGVTYFSASGEPLWPNNTPTGPQVVAPIEFGSITFKGDFFNIYNNVTSGSAIGLPVSNIATSPFIPKIRCRLSYVLAGFYVNFSSVSSLISAVVYDLANNVICISQNTENTFISPYSPGSPSFSEASLAFYFPQNIYINTTTSYYIKFETLNATNFYYIVDNTIPGSLAGKLVAEPLYCESQTIYKPNNITFAKQGAVCGSLRTKQLATNSVLLNGSVFYSAAGASAANAGLYQGTNISGNYYVKTKPVIQSCAVRDTANDGNGRNGRKTKCF
jgi:hypothetical protein